MKIAVMTWFHYENYGTALQVSALCSYLTKMGHEVDVINYLPRQRGRTIQEHSLIEIARLVFNKVFHFFVKPGIAAPQYPHYENDQKTEKYTSFLSKHISLTCPVKTLSDFEDLNSQYDAFICGSDQIWSPNNFDPRYFLDFVADENKLLAYAPSIGLPQITDKYVREQMSTLISRFHHLSIRETKGRQMIRALCNKDAEVVLDPTFLMDGTQWRDFVSVKQQSDERYMLAYMLGNEQKHWAEIEALSQKKQLTLKVIPVFESDLSRQGCISEAVGPDEFVSLIANADYVCTDSFHGTSFAIQFHKDFSVFERFERNNAINQNSRVHNILEMMDLMDRLVPFHGRIEQCGAVDYDAADRILRQKRKESKTFLQNALFQIEQSVSPIKKKHILQDHSLCCGCGSCAAVCSQKAVSVVMNDRGFLEARVNESLCIGCGKCKCVCPFESAQQQCEIAVSSLYSYKDNDNNVLMTSSSGGFAYRLSDYLIKKEYAVAGCTFDVKEQKAKHILIKNTDDLHLIQGSKYMQSSFGDCLEDIQGCHQPVAVFGTPCQIAGARKVLTNRDDIFYIDLICHGVPTYHMYSAYIGQCIRDRQLSNNPHTIDFRYKPMGWRQRYIKVCDGDNTIINYQKDDLYYRLFETTGCYAKSCYECRWRDNSVADLRIGDYWGPRFENDNTGVSMVVSLTDKGDLLMNALQHADVGIVDKQPIDDYLHYQQINNEPQPLFNDELVDRLNKDGKKLPFLVEKYSLPFERTSRNRIQRLIYMLRMSLKH